MLKYYNTRLIISLTLFIAGLVNHGICQPIVGPNPTTVGSFDEYIFSSTEVFTEYYWEMAGGVERSRTFNGTEYRITIEWLYSGEHYLMFVAVGNPTPAPQITVTVSCTPLPPVAPTVSDEACGPKTLTRGDPSSVNVSWFWQGMVIDGQNDSPIAAASTYTANVSGTYYIRARSLQGCWSTPVGIEVVVNANPTAFVEGQTILSGQTTSVLITNPNHVNGTTFNWTASSTNVVGASAGSGSTIAQTLTTTSFDDGSVTYTITPLANGCTGPNITVDVLVVAPNQYNWIKETIVLVENQTTEAQVQSLQIAKEEKNINWTYFDGLGRPMQSISVQGSPGKRDLVQPIAYDEFGREVKKYLPYVDEEATNGFYKLDALPVATNPAEEEQVYQTGKQFGFYQDGGLIAADPSPFSKTIFEPSPLNRVLEQGSAGATWQPDINNGYASLDRTIKSAYEFNAAEEVLLWTYTPPASNDPIHPFGTIQSTAGSNSPGYYGVNQLFKNKTKDEHGHEVIEYVDKEGRTILKRVQAAESVSAVDDINYASTYYIYDHYGSLVGVIPPEATARLNDEYHQSSDKEGFLERWAFRYSYDKRRRMILKQVPGAAPVYMVYDDRDRLVLTQDGNQRAETKWTYTKYDQLNRPIITGIYTHGSEIDQSDMSEEVSTAQFSESYDPTSPHGYTNNLVFPTENTTVLTATYYDTYDFRDDFIAGSEFQFKDDDIICNLSDDRKDNDFCQETSASSNTLGQVTGTKTNVLNTPDYLWNVVYYDDKYRVIQNISTNYKAGINGSTRSTSVVDFAGKVLTTKTTTAVPSDPVIGVQRWLDYDHAGRLEEIYHKIVKGTQEGPQVLLAKQEYNELGQLVAKKLHRTSGTTVVPDPLVGQPGVVYGTDLVLTQYDANVVAYVASNSITIQPGFTVPAGGTFNARLGYSQEDADDHNASQTFAQVIDYRYNTRGWLDNINDVDDAASNDLFSMDLNYDDPLANGGAPQFNGNISQALWKGPDGEKKSYGYYYDPMNRLLKGKYFSVTNPTRNGRFDELIGHETDPNKPAYDLNGNIQNLFRNGKTGETAEGVVTYGPMDALAYSYSGNQLKSVLDNEIDTQGFKDGTNTDDDYAYDLNGNMHMDQNKSLSANAITYNYLNLPQQVEKSATEYVTYVYDAAGRKLRQVAIEATTKTTDYVGEFVYENNVLQFINNEEGRVVMTGSSPEYQYHLKDHLGNVRTTFTTKAETEAPVATMETANQNEERAKFLKYDDVRKVNHAVFDHTNVGTTKYAVRLTGTPEETYGLARSLAVMPGDKIKAEVYAKYVDVDELTQGSPLLDLMNQISGAEPGLVLDGAAYGTPAAATIPFVSFLNKSGEGGVPPKAYLNWLVFDQDYNPIPSKSGYTRVTTAAKETGNDFGQSAEGSAHEPLQSPEIEITVGGFVYIYFSVEEQGYEVYFDDFEVEQVKSKIGQIDDYYPFGLTFNSYRRENSTENRYLYNQGAGEKKFNTERIFDLGLDIDLTKYRAYDPATGRWWQVDPLSDEADFISLTPYNYSFNNPVRYNDPYGDCPLCIPILIAVAEVVTEVAGVATIAAGGTTIAVGLTGLAKNAPAGAPIAGAYSPAVGMAMSTSKPGEISSPYFLNSKAKGSKNSKTNESARTGQEAHRQEQKKLKEEGAETEVPMTLKDGTKVRKDAVRPDGTVVIIKPDTPSGKKSAEKREKLMKKNGHKTETKDYDPNDPKYQPGSPTYIGPKN